MEVIWDRRRQEGGRRKKTRRKKKEDKFLDMNKRCNDQSTLKKYNGAT